MKLMWRITAFVDGRQVIREKPKSDLDQTQVEAWRGAEYPGGSITEFTELVEVEE